MVATGGRAGLWGWHGPGPGPNTLLPWREKPTTQMITRDKKHQRVPCSKYMKGDTMSPSDCCQRTSPRQGRTRVFPARGSSSFRWLLLVVLLVAGMCSRADAACTGLNCPAGCRCTDVSGSCRVDCSSSTVVLSTLTSSITAHDRVSEL